MTENRIYGACFVVSEKEIHPENEAIFAEFKVDFVWNENEKFWYLDSEEIMGDPQEYDIFEADSLEQALENAVKMLEGWREEINFGDDDE